MERHLRWLGKRSRGTRTPAIVLCLPAELQGERDSHRSAILGALAILQDRLFNTQAGVKLVFSRVKTIYSGGMLLLLASLELLTKPHPRRIRAVCPRGSMAAQLLHHFDFARRLGVLFAGNERIRCQHYRRTHDHRVGISAVPLPRPQ